MTDLPAARSTATPRTITFTVRGLPVPQGSSKAFVVGGRACITSASKGMPAWRHAIATAAGYEMAQRPMMLGPLVVEATFWLPRPKSAPKRVVVPSTRPDLDKLARALLDGCTAVLWRDDAQVVDLLVWKRFGDMPGALVQVREWEAKEETP